MRAVAYGVGTTALFCTPAWVALATASLLLILLLLLLLRAGPVVA
jgi:hypothetical protein